MTDPTDSWTASAYTASASFVPQLTQKVVSWLNPQSSDRILDLGCGDGVLTAQINSQCAAVCGLDSSPNLIEAASQAYANTESLEWELLDCRHLEQSPFLRYKHGEFDKVFSNAALHWILRDPDTRLSVLRGARQALKTNGTFIFEMGGAGNCAEVHTALLSALVHQGIPFAVAREACPWFFPSESLMTDLLEVAGFVVEKIEIEFRPTRLTEEEGGGLGGWVRLMGAAFLNVLEDDRKKEAAVKEVCEVLESVMKREEDGSWWLGYVRLRGIARRIG